MTTSAATKTEKLNIEIFIKIAQMLASPNEQERATAALKATNLLKKADLTWESLLRTGTDRLYSRTPDPTASLFSEIFSAFGTHREPPPVKFYQPKKNPIPEQRIEEPEIKQQFLSGSQIPKRIEGSVTISDERRTKTKTEMLVVTVENKRFCYGPFVVFDPQLIKLIKETPKPERRHYGVTHSNNTNLLPILTHLNT